MSLKAKLEAVIYAAEEPVTLAQLAALFAAEAFEWKAEQEAVVREAQSEADSAPLLGEEFQVVEEATIPAGSEDDLVQPQPETFLENPPEAAPEAAPVEEVAAEDESEIKRQARLRDREVRGILKEILDQIVVETAADDRGVEIREIAGGYRMATKPACHDAVRLFVKSLKPALKLSLAALETLAVIAYKQPVTAPEVSEIRGVESAGVLGSLLARKLIATAGRKQVIGRPILYKTTKEFLLRFGLKDVNELPSMEEFEKMAAIELEEPAAAAEAQEQLPLSPEDQAVVEQAASDESAQEANESLPQQELSQEIGAELPINSLDADTASVPAEMAATQPVETPAEMAAETPADSDQTA